MSITYPFGSGHCCACAGVCGHYSPATYCPRHSRHSPQPPTYWYIPMTTTTWTATRTYVGRHRKGDPAAGA